MDVPLWITAIKFWIGLLLYGSVIAVCSWMRGLDMRNLAPREAPDQPRIDSAKRQYQRPRLLIFGKVHHLTQGSQNNGDDGALGHTKN